MPAQRIGGYDVEYSAVPLGFVPGWAAYVAIYDGDSATLHRTALYPRRRVRVDRAFGDAAQAEACALEVARGLLGRKGADAQD